MNSKTTMTFKEDGVIEITEELVKDAEFDLLAYGYWQSDGKGHSEQLEPYLYLPVGGMINVITKTWGKLNVTLNFHNESGHHAGPRLPQTGGKVSLSPGYWRMYFTGWIESYKTKSGINVSLSSADLMPAKEFGPPEESVEEDGALFKVRARGGSRPQAIRIAYRRADQHAAGKPYKVIEERVYAEGSQFVCILTCELV